MPDRLNDSVIEAAGGLVERETPDGRRIAVVYRERYGGEWGLPKGKRKAGESWQETARREVREETGLDPVIRGFAGATSYLAKGVPKLVLYWRMHADRDAPFVPNDEVKRLDWLTPAEAITRLSHKEEAELVATVYHQAMSKPEAGFAARIRRAFVPIIHASRWGRLASNVAAYSEELQGRAAQGGSLAGSLPAVQQPLARAQAALRAGDIDLGWRCFHTAKRLELLGLDEAELNAAAMAIREEADKLNPWRKKAVIDLLTVKEGEDYERARVFRAAVLRDEHYDNEAYKDGLRRGSAVRLAVVLLLALIALLWLARAGYLPPATWSQAAAGGIDLYKSLISVALMGLLGATVSAVVAKPDTTSTRIPEMASTVRITILRLLMGPASAILLYFAGNSEAFKAIFKFGTPDPNSALAVAFVAGFTERLVLRVVEAIAGKPSA